MLVYVKYECFVMQMLYHVSVLNDALRMTYSLLMLVEDASSDHMEGIYSRAVL